MGKTYKKHKHLAQSTLEYALILPLLFLMILAILELGMLWHRYNTMEMITQNISANISLDQSDSCISEENMDDLISSQAGLLDAAIKERIESAPLVYEYNSDEKFSDGQNLATIKIDCSTPETASIQTSSYYKMVFFAVSLPNFATGKRIEIIPDKVKLTSNKITTINRI